MRLCSRPGCGKPAVATLYYSYAEQAVVVGPLTPEDNPHSWDLCAVHAARTRPPQGWTIVRKELPAENMTALLESVQDDPADLDPAHGAHTGAAGGSGGYANGAAGHDGAGSLDSLEQHRHDGRGALAPTVANITATANSAEATAEIQNTIARLNTPNRPGMRPHDRYHSAEYGDAPSGSGRHGLHAPGAHAAEEGSEEYEEYEPEIISPLLEAAQERERDKKHWRGRGEEISIPKDEHPGAYIPRYDGGEPQGGRHRRPEDDDPSQSGARWRESDRSGNGHGHHHRGDASTPEAQPRHPSLRNLPGRRKYHLHAVPDPDDE